MKWNIAAGGTAAADDKHSHTAFTDIGNYYISPISSPHNYKQHIGYKVQFANVKGILPQGLWQDLSDKLVNLRTAKALCKKHLKEKTPAHSM